MMRRFRGPTSDVQGGAEFTRKPDVSEVADEASSPERMCKNNLSAKHQDIFSSSLKGFSGGGSKF